MISVWAKSLLALKKGEAKVAFHVASLIRVCQNWEGWQMAMGEEVGIANHLAPQSGRVSVEMKQET